MGLNVEIEEQTLGFLLARASQSMAAALNSNLKKEGIDLPHSQFVILRFLYHTDGVCQHELASKIFKDNAAIKRSLDNLEEKGLVVRLRANQRKNSVHITDKGKLLMPCVLQCAEKTMEKVMKNITEKEYQLLRNLLERIYYNIS